MRELHLVLRLQPVTFFLLLFLSSSLALALVYVLFVAVWVLPAASAEVGELKSRLANYDEAILVTGTVLRQGVYFPSSLAGATEGPGSVVAVGLVVGARNRGGIRGVRQRWNRGRFNQETPFSISKQTMLM